MNIPTWPLVIGCAVLYLVLGVMQAFVRSYFAGRRGSGSLDGFDGFVFTFFWPIVNLVLLVIWAMEKYDDLLEAVRKRGERSVMPAENEQPGRRIG